MDEFIAIQTFSMAIVGTSASIIRLYASKHFTNSKASTDKMQHRNAFAIDASIPMRSKSISFSVSFIISNLKFFNTELLISYVPEDFY